MFLLLLFGTILMPAAVILLLRAIHFRTLFVTKIASLPGEETSFADRYRPMMRLLSPHDVEVYSLHPACKSSDLKRLRSERIDFFRRYLKLLVEDFSGTLGALESILVQSTVDRPDLARAIHASRFIFARSLLNVELNLVLYRYGVRDVEVASLVNCLSSLESLFATPASLPSAA